MKKPGLLIIFLGLLINTNCDFLKKWEDFESKEGWFRAQFPGNPVKETLPIPTANRTVQAQMYSANLRSGAYAVCYFDTTEEEEKTINLENMVRGSFENLGSTAYNKKRIEFAGYEGIEAEGKIKKGSTEGFAHFRFYLVDGRVFMLQVVGERSFVKSDKTGKFFNSFKLLDE